MVKLPLLQKLLNREAKKSDELIIIGNGYYSGINFVLMVKERNRNDVEFINTTKNKFVSLMESDYYLKDVIAKLEEDNIYVVEHFFLEGIMFIVFEREL